jgi:hypothetical protein
MKIGAVLLNWKREANLKRIIPSLPPRVPVIIWNNAPKPLQRKGLRVINSQVNQCCLGRYLAAKEFGPDIDTIITQDDDMIVLNWDELLATAEANPGKIVSNLIPSHFRRNPSKDLPDGHEILLGWGAVIPRHLTESALEPCLSTYGETPLVRREADRIFTICCMQSHIALPAKLTYLPGRHDRDIAISRQPNHKELVEQGQELARGLVQKFQKSIKPWT